jgi:hypothetical protein
LKLIASQTTRKSNHQNQPVKPTIFSILHASNLNDNDFIFHSWCWPLHHPYQPFFNYILTRFKNIFIFKKY